VVDRVTRIALGIIALAFAGIVPASAQESALPELSVGYEFQRFSGGGRESFIVPRWANVDFSYPIGGTPISAVGQYDFARKAETLMEFGTELDAATTFNTYAFGVRWTAPIYAGIRPFVQLLGGGQRFYFREDLKDVGGAERYSEWGTDAMLQFGGGVAVPLTRKWSVLGQMDYRRIFADEGINNVRLVTGFRLGIE
jgi:hypothetical protein